MVQHVSTHGRFTARGAHHPLLAFLLPTLAFLSFSCVRQCLSLSMFLPVFCTFWSCLCWSALLSVSVCLPVSLYHSVNVFVCCPDAAHLSCRTLHFKKNSGLVELPKFLIVNTVVVLTIVELCSWRLGKEQSNNTSSGGKSNCCKQNVFYCNKQCTAS